MSPDPFRSLDRIDPPDHWDEIARRTIDTDEVTVDLDRTGRGRSPRRRVALLVAAAAVVALLAGVAVAQVGDPADEGVTADEPDTPTGSGMGGPCPFTLDPDLVPADAMAGTVGTGDPVSPYRLAARSSVQTPERSPGSWALVDVDGITATVAVHLRIPDDVSVTGEVSTAQLPPDEPDVVEVIAWGPIDGGTDQCPIAEVRVRLPLTEADQALRAAEGDVIELAPYIADPLPTRILAAIRLDPADEAVPEADEPCAALLAADQPPPALTTGTDAGWTGTTADGRVFTVSGGGSEITVEVEGGGSGTATRPVALGDGTGSLVGDTGILLGHWPFEAVAGGLLRPDGSVRSENLVRSPDGSWFALPDVTADEGTRTILCDAEGRDLVALAQEEAALEDAIEDEADAYQDALDACAEEPTSCNTATTSMPDDSEETTVVPMSWEGPTGDGRAYRVEVDGDTTRAFIDEVMIGEAEQATPSWTDPMRAPGLWFSVDDATVFDAVVMGAIPPGAVESIVLDEDGTEHPSPTLTVSPDGRFYAIFGGDLLSSGGSNRAVRHRAADGTLFPVVPDHDAARGIPGS